MNPQHGKADGPYEQRKTQKVMPGTTNAVARKDACRLRGRPSTDKLFQIWKTQRTASRRGAKILLLSVFNPEKK